MSEFTPGPLAIAIAKQVLSDFYVAVTDSELDGTPVRVAPSLEYVAFQVQEAINNADLEDGGAVAQELRRMRPHGSGQWTKEHHALVDDIIRTLSVSPFAAYRLGIVSELCVGFCLEPTRKLFEDVVACKAWHEAVTVFYRFHAAEARKRWRAKRRERLLAAEGKKVARRKKP